MAGQRGRKKETRTLTQQIADLEQSIKDTEERLKELRRKKRALSEKAAAEQMETLYAAVLRSGMSVEEALHRLGQDTGAA